jgi:hypothetical protein
MTEYGTETEGTFTDANGSTVEVIANYKDLEVMSRFKRISVRIKVIDKRDETTQYLLFSDLIEEKRQAGTLVVRDADPHSRPSFTIEYPKTNIDGTYFVVRSYTELIV